MEPPTGARPRFLHVACPLLFGFSRRSAAVKGLDRLSMFGSRPANSAIDARRPTGSQRRAVQATFTFHLASA